MAAAGGLAFFFFFPTKVTLHITERYSFTGLGGPAEVRLAVMTPKSGPYQRVSNVRYVWAGECRTSNYLHASVLYFSGLNRPGEPNEAVASYTVTLWQGRASWSGPTMTKEVEPEANIESDDAGLREKAEEIAAGKTRDDAYRLFSFAADHLSWPRGSRINASSSALKAYRSAEGGCHEFANLAAALCRARGIPARVISGLWYAPCLPFWRTTRAGGAHPGGAHAWVELHTGERWEMADPSAASFMPWKGMNFGRSDAGHLSYGEILEHDRVYREMESWAAEGGKLVFAMSAPLKFAAGASGGGVTVAPQVTLKKGWWDARWAGLAALTLSGPAIKFSIRNWCRKRMTGITGFINWE